MVTRSRQPNSRGIIGCHSLEDRNDSASRKHYRDVCIIILDKILMTRISLMTLGQTGSTHTIDTGKCFHSKDELDGGMYPTNQQVLP